MARPVPQESSHPDDFWDDREALLPRSTRAREDAPWDDWALHDEAIVEAISAPLAASQGNTGRAERQKRPPTFSDSAPGQAGSAHPVKAVRTVNVDDLDEDYTGEFDDVTDDRWDDSMYSYLDDIEEPVTASSSSTITGGPVLLPARTKVKSVKKLAFRSVLALFVLLSAVFGYGAWKLTRFERNQAGRSTLDEVGVGFLPGDGAIPASIPSVTVSGVTTPLVTTPLVDQTPDTTTPVAPAPASTLVPPPTIPGEGTCADDPACAGAEEVVLPEIEVPRPGGRLVDRVDVEPIGGANGINTLIIGVDSRADIPEGQEGTFGSVAGSRSDTIIVMRTSPDGKQAALLSFPRDLYVYLPVQKRQDRVNAAYGKGVNSLIKTIQENFNVPIHHAVEIDFSGFQRVVKTLGGIEICFDKKSRDLKSGLDEEAGCHILDETRATHYVRSRYLEVEVNNKWVPDNRGDLGRVARQQNFIKQVLQKALDDGATNPIKANALLDDMQDAVTIDQKYGRGDILETLRIFSGFQPGQLQNFTVPASGAKINGMAVLRVNRAKASPVVAKFGTRVAE
jgi:LCP family protein required for cell wall assembly